MCIAEICFVVRSFRFQFPITQSAKDISFVNLNYKQNAKRGAQSRPLGSRRRQLNPFSANCKLDVLRIGSISYKFHRIVVPFIVVRLRPTHHYILININDFKYLTEKLKIQNIAKSRYTTETFNKKQ